jgi:hypothetical protein
MEIPALIFDVKGYLAEDEGLRLFELALEAAPLGPCLEIGGFCGKSTVYLGTAKGQWCPLWRNPAQQLRIGLRP